MCLQTLANWKQFIFISWKTKGDENETKQNKKTKKCDGTEYTTRNENANESNWYMWWLPFNSNRTIILLNIDAETGCSNWMKPNLKALWQSPICVGLYICIRWWFSGRACGRPQILCIWIECQAMNYSGVNIFIFVWLVWLV